MDAQEARKLSLESEMFSESKIKEVISKIELKIQKACNKGKFETLIADYYITMDISIQGYFTSNGYKITKSIEDGDFCKISW